IAFSQDGSKIATGSKDKTARLWNPATGAPLLAEPFRHDQYVEAVALSPDSRVLLTSTETDSGKVQRWDLFHGTRLGEPLPVARSYGLEFHPSGRWFLTTSTDMTARQWDSRTGEPTGPILRLPRTIFHGAYSKDGRSIATASADRTARVWDRETGQQRGPSLLHQNPVRS